MEFIFVFPQNTIGFLPGFFYQRNHLFCLNPRVKGFKVAWNGWSDMSFYTISLGD